MAGVVAMVGSEPPSLVDAGEGVARLLRADLRQVGPPGGLGRIDAVQDILDELDDPAILAAVVPDGAAMEAATGHVISTFRKPVVITPQLLTAQHPLVVSRVLLPLDGSQESAAAVAPTARLLADAGVDLVVLHVFTETTVPRFWDQAAHAWRSWDSEFLARYCPQPAVRLHLRTGAPGEQVVAVAAEEHVDLIALGWSQRLDPDRAATVRRTISESHVPVMLVPVPTSAPADRDRC